MRDGSCKAMDNRDVREIERLPSFLSECLHDARIDHLAAARNLAVPGQLAINGIEHALAGAGLDQALLEGPDRRPVRDLAAGA